MKQREKCFRPNRRNQGFTLTEMLVTVAILVILMGVTLAGLMTMRRNLRQKELDSKAEIIYVAAQYRLSELKAAGYEGIFAYTTTGNDNGVRKLGYIPADAFEADDEGETEQSAEKLCYVRSSDKQTPGMAARFMLPETAVDKDLWGNQWIIEYSPETGMVYAVFYSEGGLDMDNLDMVAMDNYRTKSYRLGRGAKIGYYGGDLTLTEGTSQLTPKIEIINAEKLIARFYCNNPDTSEVLSFQITVTTANDQSYTRFVRTDSADPNLRIVRLGARTYRYEWVMDSLEGPRTGFAAQTGLEAGTDITVSMVAHSDSELVDDEPAEPVPTNSLFAYQENAPEGTAVIAYGRHLQNLDKATSSVTDSVTAAVQIQDISFADDPADDEDFYSYYGPYFKPIENSRLRSYDGEKSTLPGSTVSGASAIQNLQVASRTGASGLFATFRGEEIKNLILTGTRLEGGSSVGALAGSVVGEVAISNCQVYLSSTRGDVGGKEADEPQNVDYRINGTTAGGLVGAVPGGSKLTICDSFAATTVAGRNYAGGLVGSANAAVTIERSYADCYLQAATTGGLIGVASPYATVDLHDIYAVGYQVASRQASGLVSGNVREALRGYAAVDFSKTTENTKLYTTAVKGTNVAQLYYVSGGSMDDDISHMAGSESVSYADLTSAGFLNPTDGSLGKLAKNPGECAFSFGGASNPYNLMDQGLNNYVYPRLTGMTHYGDWQAQFESGTLVYYEYYGKTGYGFYGGNKSTLQNREVLGDGYALVYMSEQTELPTVTYADGTALSPSATAITVTEGTNSYYLYPLPKEKLNNVPGDGLVKEGEFYQRLEVKDASGNVSIFYYNPNFAETVVSSTTMPDAPGVVLLRSPRQLYALSLLYEQYDAAVSKSLFRQELDLNYGSYRWNDYYTAGKSITVQKPIGPDTDTPFAARYDGRYHSISGLSIEAEARYVGLFGVIGSGSSVQNLVLNGEGQSVKYWRYDAQTKTYYTSVEGVGNSVDLGALAGSNEGYIRNCAVYGLTGEIYAYDSATVRVGGLVGSNYGTISACSADTRSLEMGSSFARLYGGGFAGLNRGTISESYSVGLLNFKDYRESTVTIAGFAADNNGGNLIRCYSGAALNASGEVGVYGFAPTGGFASSCYYLDKGTYAYNDQLYSFNVSANQYASKAAGTALDAAELEGRNAMLQGFGDAARTVGKDPTLTGSYPYPASVKDGEGKYVHYGYWPNQEKNIGTVGVFYWEQEVGGSSGYHISYVGTINGEVINGDPLQGASLCTNHDDGGYVASYGYGYFYSADIASNESGLPVLAVDSGCTLGARNTAAEAELADQMPKYTFVAYTTGENSLHLTSSAQNATWTLYYPYVERANGSVNTTSSGVYTYTVCPFFGNSVSLDSISRSGSSSVSAVSGAKPGTEANPYEVRSVDQLQNINWNYAMNSAEHTITGSTTWNDFTAKDTDVYGSSGQIYSSKSINGKVVYASYPYLTRSHGNDTRTVKLYWKQSHNVDAALEMADTEFFTPIGSMFDTADSSKSASYPVMAYFSSSFDGDSYSIKNIQVKTDAQMVGVFGITVGAEMKNVVLYADTLVNGQKRAIQNTSDGSNWYSIGGLVGFAASADSPKSLFTNCTVSGYRIVDNRGKDETSTDFSKYNPGWGGACIGGLVGTTNMNITGCTAVTDIELRFRYNIGWENVRVGGIAGCSRGTFTGCYAGGSIQDLTGLSRGGAGNSTSVWTGGIVGGLIVRNTGDLKKLVGNVDGEVIVTSCYSYVEMPGKTGAIAGSHSIASNGEMQDTGFRIVNTDGNDEYTIQNPHVLIVNSYALDSAVQYTEDYNAKKNQPDTYWRNTRNYSWNKGINVNQKNTVNERGIYFRNDHSPYVTYEAMQSTDANTSLYAYLKSSSFSWVTTQENGASVAGKYSYPGSDRQLKGQNYPFPTVLHQTSTFSTVNVHYGEWPKLGIYWEEHTLTMDMLADRTAAVTALDTGALPVQTEPVEDQTAPPETEQPQPPEEEAAVQSLPANPAENLPEEEQQTAAAESLQDSETENPEEEQEDSQENTQEDTQENTQEDTQENTPALLSLDALAATHSYKLYVAGLDDEIQSVNKGNLTYTLMDEARNVFTDPKNDAPAYIESTDDLVNAGADHYFGVNFQANFPGVMLVEAKLKSGGKDYVALLTLTVTADLQISIEPSSIETYVGDKTAYTVTLTDTEGNPFAPAADAELKWSMDYPAQAAQVVAWDEDKDGNLVIKRNQDGTYTLNLEGILSGEGSVNLSLSYKWNARDPDSLTIESTLNIRALTKPSDVLGIGDGMVFQQITVPHTIPGDTTSFTGEDLAAFPGTAPALDTVYLYATTDYTKLAAFTVKSVEFKVGSGDYGAAENISAVVSDTVTDSNGYACRAIAVTDNEITQWSMRVTLQRDGIDYVLVYSRPNRVEFTDTQGNVLKTVRVPQGQETGLTQDALAEELTGQLTGQTPETGHRWLWEIPGAADITGNIQVRAQQSPIHYFISYDGNYEGWEWNEQEKDEMADSEFIYNSPDNALRPNVFTRPGYAFLGWATSPEGDVEYADKASFADFTDITTHGAYLSLYAKWVQGTYSVTFHANDGTAAAVEKTYTTGDAEDTLPSAESLGFASNGVFLGWATQSDAAEPMAETTYSQVLAKAGYEAVNLYAVWQRDAEEENPPESGDNPGNDDKLQTDSGPIADVPSAGDANSAPDGEAKKQPETEPVTEPVTESAEAPVTEPVAEPAKEKEQDGSSREEAQE